jgi:hypothetical protein
MGVVHAHVLRLATVDRVAEAPAAQRVRMARLGVGAALRHEAVEAGVALAAGRDRADDHALADPVAAHGGAELLDHPDRLVTHDSAALDRVLALKDMDVGTADGGRGDADQGVAWPDLRYRLLVEHDPARLDEHGRLHGAHGSSSTF